MRLLLVDADANSVKLVKRALARQQVELWHAANAAEARRHLNRHQPNVVLIDCQLPDGCGSALAQQIISRKNPVQLIMLSGNPSVDAAVDALRLGAGDFISKPLKLDEVRSGIRRALQRYRSEVQRRRRMRHLQNLCVKLDGARQQISEQVDVLCKDLVVAYQQLATQLQQVSLNGELSTALATELDLKSIIRKTLQYLLQQAGPTNAALFLPSAGDEYSLGGYINLASTPESADMMLQHLADVAAPKLAQCQTPLHIRDNAALEKFLGDDAAYLADCEVIGFTAFHDDEPLAMIIMFRDNEPYAPRMLQVCGAVAASLAQALARTMRVHHRRL